jgi:sarcosine oxidase
MTGGLMIGSPKSDVVSGVLSSVREHHLPHEILTPAQVRTRFPEFHLAADEIAVFERDAGYLDPERCIAAHCRLAAHFGAQLHFDEKFLRWESLPDHRVRVVTNKGQYTANRLCLSVGTWAPQVYAQKLGWPLRVERRALFWFEPHRPSSPAAGTFDKIPIYIWEPSQGVTFYGFPRQSGPPGGVKVAGHYVGESAECTPETIKRTVSEAEVTYMRSLIKERLPALNGPLVETATCMYTITPTTHFVIDRHPATPSVLLVSPCSGHGFKFASVVGEIVSDLVLRGMSGHDISLFSIAAHGWSQPAAKL